MHLFIFYSDLSEISNLKFIFGAFPLKQLTSINDHKSKHIFKYIFFVFENNRFYPSAQYKSLRGEIVIIGVRETVGPRTAPMLQKLFISSH